MASKCAPKVHQKVVKMEPIFGSTFLKPLELCRSRLEAFLGLPRLSWTALAAQKPLKTLRFLRFFQMQVFATLKPLMGLLEPILAHLRPICSQKGALKLIKKCSKKCPKTRPKRCPKNNKKWTSFGPQNDLQNPSKLRSQATRNSGLGVLKSFWSQEGPKVAQDGPEEPRIAPSWPQKAPKIAPRWLKMAPRSPRQPQVRPKKLPRSPQYGTSWAKMGQNGPKILPKLAKGA